MSLLLGKNHFLHGIWHPASDILQKRGLIFAPAVQVLPSFVRAGFS